MEEKEDRIILFDGICKLCSGMVNFINSHGPKANFKIFPLQSPIGKDIQTIFCLSENSVNTVLLIENGILYKRSTAGLRILLHLGWPWKIFYALIIVPRPIRDIIYNLIAKTRYRIFGKKTSCKIQ